MTSVDGTRAEGPATNIRHDLEPALVQAQVQKRLAALEARLALDVDRAKKAEQQYLKAVADGKAHLWPQAPTSPAQLAKSYRDGVNCEKAHYALVRVIERPKGLNRFILVYGDEDDSTVESGTGPFATLEEASQWHLQGGR